MSKGLFPDAVDMVVTSAFSLVVMPFLMRSVHFSFIG